MRTMLLIGGMLTSLFVFAQSNLTVFNNGGQKFYLILNGIKQNSLAQTNVVVSGIKNGGYSVKLIFEDNKTKDIDKNFFLESAQDITTKVTFKKGVGKLQMVSMVPTQGTAQGGVTYRPDNTAVFSDAVTTTTTTTTQTIATETSPIGGNASNGNGNGNGNGSVGIQFNATTPEPIQTNPTNNVNGNGNVNISVTDPTNGQNINMNVNMNMNG